MSGATVPGPPGFAVAPRWEILPAGGEVPAGRLPLFLEPGEGWGSGDHPTTRLCLAAIAALAPRDASPWTMLDFGAGSGLLSLAGARLGAQVAAVEIDPQGLAHAGRNAHLNALAAQVALHLDLAPVPGPFQFVVANILRAVLLDFAQPLCERVAPGGTLVLSGLVATDVPELSVRYAAHRGQARPEVYALGEWRALAWRRATPRERGASGPS